LVGAADGAFAFVVERGWVVVDAAWPKRADWQTAATVSVFRDQEAAVITLLGFGEDAVHVAEQGVVDGRGEHLWKIGAEKNL